MSHIVVSREEATLIAESPSGVEILDADGHFVGYAAPTFSAQELAAAERSLASGEPRHTTAEVLAYLKSLEQQ